MSDQDNNVEKPVPAAPEVQAEDPSKLVVDDTIVPPDESVVSPISPEAIKKHGTENKPGYLRTAFNNIAGVTISGSLLTAGVATFVEMGSVWTDLSLTQQFINTSSTLSGHLAVWAVAMAVGATGWALGKSFDKESMKLKPRAAAAGIGAALIAASFAMPLNDTVSTKVNNTLSGIFLPATQGQVINAPTESESTLSSQPVQKSKPAPEFK